MNLYEIKKSVVNAGIKLTEEGLIARTWGNVSCRIDNNRFAITPSGRSYLSLTPEDIVEVNISDCSYEGNIKPSSEKGIHADVYKLHPEVNFVIHTHQNNASVISALDLDSMKIEGDSSLLGKEVILASYGLPGTKKLRRGVSVALRRSVGNAIIMKNHGALCFGKSPEEAFETAVELEKACEDFIIKQYMTTSGRKFDKFEMMRFSLMKLTENTNLSPKYSFNTHYESERTTNGFTFHDYSDTHDIITHIDCGESDDNIPFEAKVHKRIYKNHKNINYIIHSNKANTTAVSCTGIQLKPLVDDFAQIVGLSIKNSKEDISKISSALKNASAVFIENNGALCCGASKEDASAVSYILEKGCNALIGAALFGKVKPLNYFDCVLMRFVYLKKYSKQADIK